MWRIFDYWIPYTYLYCGGFFSLIWPQNETKNHGRCADIIWRVLASLWQIILTPFFSSSCKWNIAIWKLVHTCNLKLVHTNFLIVFFLELMFCSFFFPFSYMSYIIAWTKIIKELYLGNADLKKRYISAETTFYTHRYLVFTSTSIYYLLGNHIN